MAVVRLVAVALHNQRANFAANFAARTNHGARFDGGVRGNVRTFTNTRWTNNHSVMANVRARTNHNRAFCCV